MSATHCNRVQHTPLEYVGVKSRDPNHRFQECAVATHCETLQHTAMWHTATHGHTQNDITLPTLLFNTTLHKLTTSGSWIPGISNSWLYGGSASTDPVWMVCLCMELFIHRHTHVCIHTSKNIHADMHGAYIHMCTYIWYISNILVCIHTYTLIIHTHVHTYISNILVCIYTYTLIIHTHIQNIC